MTHKEGGATLTLNCRFHSYLSSTKVSINLHFHPMDPRRTHSLPISNTP